MTTTEEWLQRDETAMAAVLPRIFDIVAERGEGSWLFDVEGRRYLDMTSGIAVTSVGHCNPAVVEAVEQQARSLLHTSVVTHHTRRIELAEKLRAATPFIEDAQVFFCNSGAEAVDGSLKMARKVTHRPGVIAFRRAFHGRTLGATSITTAKGKYRSGYEPLLPGVHIAPYCDDGNAEQALASFDEVLTLQAPEPNIGAVIVEPVLGEGGYIIPPVEWLRGLRQRCTERGMLLIFDEVQTGIGRTGSVFAAEGFGVTPDIVLFAKGIANGLPLAGIIASRSLMDQWPNSSHGTTFGANPLSCAAGLAVLSIVHDDAFLARVRDLGERILGELRAVSSSHIVDVRGIGLMIGVELDSGEFAAEVQDRCKNEGVLVLTCAPQDNVIRLIPSLNITDDEVATGLRVLTRALQA